MHPWQHSRPAITTNFPTLDIPPYVFNELLNCYFTRRSINRFAKEEIIERNPLKPFVPEVDKLYTVKCQFRINYVDAFFPQIYFTIKRMFLIF